MKIYHNPKCRKSRQTLEIIRKNSLLKAKLSNTIESIIPKNDTAKKDIKKPNKALIKHFLTGIFNFLRFKKSIIDKIIRLINNMMPVLSIIKVSYTQKMA